LLITTNIIASDSEKVAESSTNSGAGLPDGIFSYQKYQFGQIFEGRGLKMLVFLLPIEIFYGHLVYLHMFVFYGRF
jgi:hypothetical protein